MKVIYGIGKAKNSFKRPVLVIGVFDGLHLGHQMLIKRAIRKAKVLKAATVVMTFHPHPVHVLHPEVELPLIVSLPYRLKLIEDLGVDACIVIPFSKNFSQVAPEQFIRHYLVDYLNPQEVFVGDDFRFGQNRNGTLNFFEQAGHRYGFHVNVVHQVQDHHRKIGSTLIRQLIAEGKLHHARRLLGRYVSVMGKVSKGDARGKTLGFPTANIYPQNEIIPPLGVYAVNVIVGKMNLQGVANVGRRPSFKTKDNRVNVEVHILDFHKNLYGKEIIVEFIKKIRNEKIFNLKEKLIQQIQRDIHKVKVFFSK